MTVHWEDMDPPKQQRELIIDPGKRLGFPLGPHSSYPIIHVCEVVLQLPKFVSPLSNKVKTLKDRFQISHTSSCPPLRIDRNRHTHQDSKYICGQTLGIFSSAYRYRTNFKCIKLCCWGGFHAPIWVSFLLCSRWLCSFRMGMVDPEWPMGMTTQGRTVCGDSTGREGLLSCRTHLFPMMRSRRYGPCVYRQISI